MFLTTFEITASVDNRLSFLIQLLFILDPVAEVATFASYSFSVFRLNCEAAQTLKRYLKVKHGSKRRKYKTVLIEIYITETVDNTKGLDELCWENFLQNY